MPEINKDTVRKAVKDPLSWVAGAVFSAFAVAASFGVEPISAAVIVLTVLYNNAMTLFTASSILGFTVAPEVPWIPARFFEAVAILLGLMVVGQIGAQVWDKVVDRLEDG